MKLPDLYKLRSELSAKASNYNGSEMILSEEFKSKYREESDTKSIHFFNGTAVAVNTENQQIFIPNQWFYLAAISVPFFLALLQYRDFLSKIYDNANSSFKTDASAAKNITDQEKDSTEIVKKIKQLDLDKRSEQQLIEFVTNYESWGGGKTIDRNDFVHSPVLSALGLVQASCNYVIDILKIIAQHQDLAETAKQVVNENDTLQSDQTEDFSIQEIDKPNYTPVIVSGYSHNRIIFGAPGTGKSFKLDQDRKDLLHEGGSFERVTFHPDYSYSTFVGTYKPTMIANIDGDNEISYEYVPGPFIRTYVDAIKNKMNKTNKPILLIIEEINRANVGAVFGDLFQLLDRNSDGASTYEIEASEDLKMYLSKELGGSPSQFNKLSIPNNLYILATMNSADQGVYPMDTAFKRRWNFEYISVDENEKQIDGEKFVLGKDQFAHEVEWNELRKSINLELTSYNLNEDKLIGPFFLSSKQINNKSANASLEFCELFKNKVLMYLFEDAARQKRSEIFSGAGDFQSRRYSELCRQFDIKGVEIFSESIVRRLLGISQGG